AAARERERTLVYMGSFMPYKNVEALVRAVAQLPGYRLQLLSAIDRRERSRLEALAPEGSLEFLDRKSVVEGKGGGRGAPRRRRHTSFSRDWSSNVCSSDLRRGPRARAHACLHGLVHAVQERRGARARSRAAPRLPPATAERDRPARAQ